MPGAFPLIGSKGSIAKRVIEMIPPHQCYVEPFGGSGAILLTKSRSKVEVYNDLNSQMVNFLCQVRDNVDRLQWLVRFTPYSREVYEGWKSEWKVGRIPEDPTERAARWFFLQWSAVNQEFGRGWKHSSSSNDAMGYQSHCDRLVDVARRLTKVVIEKRDFAELIKKYDTGPDVMFYIDPPYVSTKAGHDYYHYMQPDMPKFNIERHRELAELLHQIQGKAIVSYYPHPLVDKLYDGWHRYEIDVTKSTGGVNGKAKDEAVELLLSNFEPLPLFRGVISDS